jgi:hypothetical protein
MQRGRAQILAAMLLTALVAGMALTQNAETPSVPVGTRIANLSFRDIDGVAYTLADLQRHRAVVFVFFSIQCPMARKYPSRIARLHETFEPQGVAFFVVNPMPHEPLSEVRQYVREVSWKMPVIKGWELAQALGATVTPQAVVLDSNGVLRYRGRIDDNADEAQVTRHDLRDAIVAVLEGKPVPNPETPAQGCVIAFPKPRPKTGSVTFYRDVLPILQNRCQSCHRPNGAAPFPLMTYEEASAFAPLIKPYVQTRRMPPWKAEPVAEYLNERRLSEAEIATIVRWVEEGCPEGDQKDAPPPKQFASGWMLGEPDLVLEPDREFRLEATGRDVYRHFVFPTNFPEDKFVTAIEVIPGNPRVVHHVIAFIDTSGRAKQLDGRDGQPGYEAFGGPGFIPAGGLGGWAPGNIPVPLPDGIAYRLPKGATIVIQVHYHKSGKPETDRTKVGIYFAKQPPRQIVHVLPVLNFLFAIPPGAERHEVRAEATFTRDVKVLAVMPHMHLLGREMKVTAILPDGTEKPLVWVRDWDFNWQETYFFKEPLRLPAGTKVQVVAYYDNSEKNPRNPNKPPKWVRWGEQTTDEMCIAFVWFVHDDTRTAAR